MDFSWSEAQTELYEGALKFARSLSRTLRATDSRRGVPFPDKAWRECGQFGLLGLSVPPVHGGLGVDALTTARIVEGCGRGLEDSGLLFSASAHLFAVTMPIVEHAAPSLQSEVLPHLARGDWIGANAITEPTAGSDTSRLATRAVRDGQHYIIEGEKCFVTNAPVADLFLVYATTNPRGGYMGQSAFVVARDTPGLKVGTPYLKCGLTSAPLAAVYLSDCRVPSSNLVGSEGQGSRIFARSMAWERACLFAAFVGAMDAQLDRCLDYARNRIQYGRAIAANQAVSHRIAEMKRRLEAARLLLYQACWKRDRGHEATLEISLAKLAISEAAVESGLDAIRIHGGAGYMKATGIDRGLLDGIGSTLFSGTSDIQRELIAHRLLGSAATKRSGARERRQSPREPSEHNYVAAQERQ